MVAGLRADSGHGERFERRGTDPRPGRRRPGHPGRRPDALSVGDPSRDGDVIGAVAGQRDALVCSLERVVEGDLDRGLRMGAAGRSRPRSTEHAAEEISQVDFVEVARDRP